MENKYSLLIIDDEKGIQHGLKTFFNKRGFNVFTTGKYDEAVRIVKEKNIDAAVVDIRLKGNKNGIDLISELKKLEPDIIAIVITGYSSVDTAVTSMKLGASDYIVKPIDNQKLLDAIVKNLEMRNLKNENIFLRNEILSRYDSFDFITDNKELKTVLRKIDRIKDKPITVLITGETGTGKEILSRYIHFTSNRKDKRFVTINCAALSRDLLLSELFGHEKGSFTGAIERKMGKFEIAHGGTLFLDEIGDMSLDIQAKLLRVIEENRFERVGGTKRIEVDVRLIAATNKDLGRMMKEGKFREDLYYRIAVFSVNIPPLRDRPEDIPILIKHFIKKYNKKYNKNVIDFNNDAYNALLSHKWPGNVRELENIVNQAVLLSDSKIINLDELVNGRIFIPIQNDKIMQNEKKDDFEFDKIKDLKMAIANLSKEYEKKILHYYLEKNNFNKSKTAKELGITRKTLDFKIKSLNIHDIHRRPQS